jgi:hypothetical protein
VADLRPPLLVTGMPRTATSWTGKMLEASGRFVYVNEPLNPRHPPGRSPGVLRATVSGAFQYVCADNEASWLPAFRDLARLRYHPLAEARANHALRPGPPGEVCGRLRRRAAARPPRPGRRPFLSHQRLLASVDGWPRTVLGHLVPNGIPLGQTGLVGRWPCPLSSWTIRSLDRRPGYDLRRGRSRAGDHGPPGGVGSFLLAILRSPPATPSPSPGSVPKSTPADHHRRRMMP